MLIPSAMIGCASPAALPTKKIPWLPQLRTPGRRGPVASGILVAQREQPITPRTRRSVGRPSPSPRSITVNEGFGRMTRLRIWECSIQAGTCWRSRRERGVLGSSAGRISSHPGSTERSLTSRPPGCRIQTAIWSDDTPMAERILGSTCSAYSSQSLFGREG